MMKKLHLAIAQFNPTVGDVEGNLQRILKQSIEARDRLKADLVVFPELSLTGYPPEDLLLRPDFIRRVGDCMHELTTSLSGIDCVVGYPESEAGLLYNSAAVIRDGEVVANYRKQRLPNYGVFDEKRYFSEGDRLVNFDVKGVQVGLTICEDVWQAGVVEETVAAGAKLIVNLNASPFHSGKQKHREAVLRERIKETKTAIVYVNQEGGQDELVFDGSSFVMNCHGEVVYRAEPFKEQLALIEFECGEVVEPTKSNIATEHDAVETVYQALVCGIRDYVGKNGFKGAVLGLSGGIDSALTLALAVDALGADAVEVLMMPSRYTASMSNDDAEEEARLLNVKHFSIPIEPAFKTFLKMLEAPFKGLAADTTEENIQARCRGILLMALSNKSGKILLTTGNKSEMSVGYATLYGDMAGGFAPLKDVPKMLVFELSRYRNSLSEVIPERVITRPPSAELAADQKDEDSLPPYPVLDAILARYVEQDQSVQEIIDAGFDSEQVRKVVGLVDRNEYKRRQAPPGVKITARAYGRDRRYPMTSGFRSK
ncbi:MAG: NAD+ synthase [Gammaproteobacteria bacterium]|nr:MAG: NAD+ synthase [Gammaproteobacteria bacterium]RLA23977.1 MAG: NAD+ synthase [Gammaproteobacteria bacterium]